MRASHASFGSHSSMDAEAKESAEHCADNTPHPIITTTARVGSTTASMRSSFSTASLCSFVSTLASDDVVVEDEEDAVVTANNGAPRASSTTLDSEIRWGGYGDKGSTGNSGAAGSHRRVTRADSLFTAARHSARVVHVSEREEQSIRSLAGRLVRPSPSSNLSVSHMPPISRAGRLSRVFSQQPPPMHTVPPTTNVVVETATTAAAVETPSASGGHSCTSLTTVPSVQFPEV